MTMRRFWRSVEVAPAEIGWSVLLDARPVRLGSGAPLVVAAPALAHAIAAEWRTLGSQFEPAEVRLTTLAGRAQALDEPARAALLTQLHRYGAADLLCYRVEHPADLARQQAASWQPWLDWAAAHHDAPLLVTTGITRIDQPAASLAALATALEQTETAPLVTLAAIVPILGSLVLGLAVAERAIDWPQAAELATLEQRSQAERWGDDAQAMASAAAARAEIALAVRFMELSAQQRMERA